MTTASKRVIRKTGDKPAKTAANASRRVPTDAGSQAAAGATTSTETRLETPAAARTAALKPIDRRAAGSGTASGAPRPPEFKPPGQRIGYTRVSSLDQNEARQLDGIQGLDRIFHDHASGKDTDRPELRKLLTHLRDGDHLLVHSLDRLARSLADLQKIVETLTSTGVTVEFVKEHLVFEPPRATGEPHRTAYSMLMLQMLGAVSQFERALIRDRQREGIALAKIRGVYKGRKPSLDQGAIAKLKSLNAMGMKKSDIAATLNVSRATVYSYLST
jgi:DNA invertase Pin-like site-specific DNA recombinase